MKSKHKIMVIDVGNTNITVGVFSGDDILTTFRLMTQEANTSDEYGATIRSLLRANKVSRSEIEGVIIASVVPKVMHSWGLR